MRLRVQTIIVALILTISTAAAFAANNRPLIYGMNPTPMSWWNKDPLTWDPLLFQKMAEGGCTSARIGINWDQVEPTQGTRDWTEMDRWVKLCLDNNIEPVILINSTPEWALPADCDRTIPSYMGRYPPGEDHAQDFHNWVFDLVRRYRGRARYYEFWNEANGYGWYTALAFAPPEQYSRGDLYTPWMVRAYKATKLADPTSQMSTTGIDDGGDGHASQFLKLIYNYGGKGYFDAVADHPYPFGGNFQTFKLDQIRDRLDTNGDTDVKVWITEFGYNWGTFTGEVDYYFDQLIQDQYDYVRIATWHTANEFPWEAGYGLLDSNLNPKPEYNTFKNRAKPSRPTISGISVTNLSPSSARVNFTTSPATRALVMYGADTNYGRITGRETSATTSHAIVLTGLTPGALCHYRIRAGAVDDGDSFSADRTFTSQTGQVVQVTSGPTVSGVTVSGATVTWTTNVASTGTVQYGTDFGYPLSAASGATGASHTVRLEGLTPGTNYQYRVVSTVAGRGDAVVEGYPFTTHTTTTLVNPGFEDGAAGWAFWQVYPWRPDYAYIGHLSVYSNGGAYGPTPACKEGSKRITLDVGYASTVGGFYQTVNAENGPYLVGGWVAAGCDGGEESIQLIAMDGPYTGGIPTGTIVADLAESADWAYYSGIVDVTSGQLTVAIRASQFHAVNVVAGHFDGISVAPATRGKMGSLKSQPAGRVVTTASDVVVSAVIDANTFYAQEQDRSAGIRVSTSASHGREVGDTIGLFGTLLVENGEAVISDAHVTSPVSGEGPEPLGVTCRALGGGPSGTQPGIKDASGLNNTGLLVRAAGKVTAVSSSGFTMTDGVTSLKCALAGANAVLAVNNVVAATGVSSCELVGSDVRGVLRVRSSTDVRVFTP